MEVGIRLLGPQAIERDGLPAAPPRGRKSWALLAYLLLAERPPGRRHLAELLFSEADDPLGALRWTLAELRRTLAAPGLFGGDPVATSLGDGIAVDVDALTGELADPGSLLDLDGEVARRPQRRGQPRVRVVAGRGAPPPRGHGRGAAAAGGARAAGGRTGIGGGGVRGDEEGAVVLHEAIRLAVQAGDQSTAATASRELGFVDVQAGRRQTAETWLTRAEALADTDVELAAVLGVRGMNASDMGDYPAAFQHLHGSVERARRGAAARQQAWSLSLLAAPICCAMNVARRRSRSRTPSSWSGRNVGWRSCRCRRRSRGSSTSAPAA